MSRDGKRAEGPKMSSISQRYKTERDDDQEDSLLMHMPPEQE